MLTWTKASVVLSTIPTYITTDKFGDGIWHWSSESFILHWQKQDSSYEKLVDIADIFSDKTNRAML